MFDLTAAEVAMLTEYRRLAALFWLIKLRSGNAGSRGSRRDALTRQAQRLHALLTYPDL